MYADDIPIRPKTGSTEHIQTQLQEALNKTEESAETIALTCSTKKTPIQLMLQSTAIPTPPTIKILGQHFQMDGGGPTTVNSILKQGEQLLLLMN
ncbi:hypothetical protein HPB48_016122 [Haemaphysalis longicornis]|uniref:Uncharacterized protein n=1 Tax=Haemaphysalis longicornis TaxID=44386 RepID=A0A9J6GQS1_HAELO|nr:hypothetical protein HPB48_016122 [Haemaphysalis longicornis]